MKALPVIVLVLACGTAPIGTDGSLTSYGCSGNSCTCIDNASCSNAPCDSMTSECEFMCNTGSTCSGRCGDTCEITCNGASCQFTVGPNANLTCNAGTCGFTCTGICDITGSSSYTCVSGSKDAAGTGCH